MTVWCMTLRDLAVGIHVSQTPRMTIFRSNGRVKQRVHLRIRLFDTVLTSIWHCLALYGTVWPYMALYTTVPGTGIPLFLGRVYHCSWDGSGTGVHMGAWEGLGRVYIWVPGRVWARVYPWVGPWQYQGVYYPGIPTRTTLPRVHPSTAHAVPASTLLTGCSTLRPFCQNCH